ncbi:MAG: helix-turn-helix transcriptional regulator [Lachnospiraceae bacterium]|nr:helix-turn-helix transcriptional regulator [Lachnospiraceae bacterium]MBO4823782.1 helix-turn-helix transcriptional regulator [Lachnospiraceae bacterium]
MDMVKIGSFLQELRQEHGLTQAELGDKLGVTNKTISRWETGNYMPPVEMLEMLSNLYGLTINELLSGQKLTTEEYKEMAEENIKETLNASTFELQEKIDYFKRKWRKEHIVAFVFLGVMWACVLVLITLNGLWWPMVISLGMLLAVLLYMILNNMMMAYVEDHVYGGKWNKYESKKE